MDIAWRAHAACLRHPERAADIACDWPPEFDANTPAWVRTSAELTPPRAEPAPAGPLSGAASRQHAAQLAALAADTDVEMVAVPAVAGDRSAGDMRATGSAGVPAAAGSTAGDPRRHILRPIVWWQRMSAEQCRRNFQQQCCRRGCLLPCSFRAFRYEQRASYRNPRSVSAQRIRDLRGGGAHPVGRRQRNTPYTLPNEHDAGVYPCCRRAWLVYFGFTRSQVRRALRSAGGKQTRVEQLRPSPKRDAVYAWLAVHFRDVCEVVCDPSKPNAVASVGRVRTCGLAA
jgi:hypothetical protein